MLNNKNREVYLKIGVGIVAGLFLLDKMVLSPAIDAWGAQGERLTELRKKVVRGRQLIERESSLRGRWNDMQKTDLAEEGSVAENDVYQAIIQWARNSRINFTSLTPTWRSHEDGYDTFECRATATGDQAALGRLIYEIESDPLPAHIEDCELSTRDAKGKELAMVLKFSFVRIAQSSTGKAGR